MRKLITEESAEKAVAELAAGWNTTPEEVHAILDVDLEKILAEKLVALDAAILGLHPGDKIRIRYGSSDRSLIGEYVDHDPDNKLLQLNVKNRFIGEGLQTFDYSMDSRQYVNKLELIKPGNVELLYSMTEDKK